MEIRAAGLRQSGAGHGAELSLAAPECPESVGWLRWPLAEAAHRHGVAGVDRASGVQGLEDRLDETVARVAGEAFAVGAEIGQLALLVPDRHRGTGRYAGAAGGRGEGLHGAQGGR